MQPRIAFQTLPQEPWMDLAECRGMDPSVFYPEDGHYLLSQPAKEICNFCTVQMSCLKYALDHRIDDGIWGGTTRNQRRRIRRARAARLRLANSPRDRSQLRYG